METVAAYEGRSEENKQYRAWPLQRSAEQMQPPVSVSCLEGGDPRQILKVVLAAALGPTETRVTSVRANVDHPQPVLQAVLPDGATVTNANAIASLIGEHTEHSPAAPCPP